MSDYKVPHNGPPDYQVPVAVSEDGEGCPNCGSHALYPNVEGVLGRVPPHLQILQCARCGTRYRLRPKVQTWRGLAHEWSILFGIVFLIIVLMIIF
jgi:hypothetical protein